MLPNSFNVSCKKYGYLLPIQPYCIVFEFHFQTYIVVRLVDYDAVIVTHGIQLWCFGNGVEHGFSKDYSAFEGYLWPRNAVSCDKYGVKIQH